MFTKSLAAINAFNFWLGALPHRHKSIVPGNHEAYLEANPCRPNLTDNATVLIDEAVTIEGFNFYGSALTPLRGGVFGGYLPAD